MAQPDTTRTVGLALEGGGYRGMYTAGVLDVWMEHGLTCDHMVGVSAGAAFGYNFKSRQIGRAIRYNKAYCADKRYASVTSWLRTGDMFNADFAYHEVPLKRDPIDLEAYRACPMRFTCVCTDIETGEAVYHDLPYGDERDIEWIRASSAIPVATKPVRIEAYLQDVAVALVMPKDVVAVLKVIDVDKSHGDGQFLLPELLEGTDKAAAVAKSGKLVGKGGPDQIVLTFKKVADGLFERLGVIADSIHVVSGFLRSGELRRASSLCTRVVVRRFTCIQAPASLRCWVNLPANVCS